MSETREPEPRGRLREVLSGYVTFDARAFAVMRVYLATLLFCELVRRFPSRHLFLAGDGLFPAPDPSVADPHTFPTLVPLNATHGQIDAFFAFGFLAAVLLGIGLFTRAASIAAWLVVASYVNRSRSLTNGGDLLFAFSMFYAMFAPLGLRGSLDARLFRKGQEKPRTLVSGTGFVFVLQWTILYSVTSIAKHGDAWIQGTAISEALRTAYVASRLGASLSDLPPFIDKAMSWSALVIELSLPLLLMTPFARVRARTVAAILIFALHAGIALLMDVGVFSFATFIVIPLLLPSELYDALESRLTRAAPSRAHLQASPVVRVLQVALVLLVVTSFAEHGLHALYPRGGRYTRPQWLTDLYAPLAASQRWVMFAPRPPRTSDAIAVSARTVDGRFVDPLAFALSGDARVRTRVPGRIGPTHLVGSYTQRVAPIDPLETSRRDGLAHVITHYADRTGRPEDRIVSYRVTRLMTPTPARLRLDPRPLARESTRALLGAWRDAAVRFANVRALFVHARERATDGLVAPRGTDARSPLAAVFDSRCGRMVFTLSREAEVRAILLSASNGGAYSVELGATRLLLPAKEDERVGTLASHVLDVPGIRTRTIRVQSNGGIGVASISEIMVFERDGAALRARLAREPVTTRPMIGTPDLPHYEPLLFGPALGTRCAGGAETIPPLLAADTGLGR